MLLLVFAMPVAAHADPGGGSAAVVTGSAPSAEDARMTRWYGWQNISVVLPSAVALALSRSDGPDHSLGWLMFPGYVGAILGSPIVHGSHGEVARSLLSATMALSSVVLFGKLVPTTCDRDLDAPRESDACLLNARRLVPAGAPIGALVAVSLDAAFLAWETVPVRHSALTPYFTADARGTLLGIRGTF